ncbi:MAG TPA: efflux RND transporter periplasmic adaptor subunit [Bryobacteraceae bacterium]|nr:efflux RND transporter periplasmic adaptor subunit [Bryobacteraceae bacterium]
MRSNRFADGSEKHKYPYANFYKLTLVAGLLLSCRQQQAPVPEARTTPVRVATVELYTPAQGAAYSASILPKRQVNLAFKVNGFVEKLYQVRGANGRMHAVDIGDVVAQGTTLAQVRVQDYRLQVSQVQGQVQQATEAEQTASAQLAQAQAAALKAEQDFERADTLFKKTSLTKSDYDAAKANRDSTRAQVDAARSQQQASAGAMHASQAMLGTANLGLSDTSLTAPFMGSVVQRSIEVGSLAGPSLVAFVLADVSSVKATFAVSDIAVTHLKRGSPLVIYTEAFPNRRFQGVVSAIGAVADSSTRSFQVEVTIPNKNGMLRPGMIASLEIGESPESRPVMVAPLNAIVRAANDTNQFAVVAVMSGIARRRPVTLGSTYGDRIAVSGVEAGEKIVSQGATFVSDGDAVTVIP